MSKTPKHHAVLISRQVQIDADGAPAPELDRLTLTIADTDAFADRDADTIESAVDTHDVLASGTSGKAGSVSSALPPESPPAGQSLVGNTTATADGETTTVSESTPVSRIVDLGENDGFEPLFRSTGRKQPLLPDPLEMLAEHMVMAALSLRDRSLMAKGGPIVVAAIVPTEASLQPVEAALCRLLPDAVSLTRAGKGKDTGSRGDRTLEMLRKSRPSIGVSLDLAALPPTLRTAADLVLTLPKPDPVMVRTILAVWCKKRVPIVRLSDIAGLDLTDLAAAMRPNTKPKAILECLRRAAARKRILLDHGDAPTLADLPGLGSAGVWANDVVAEIDRRRQTPNQTTPLQSALLYGPPGTGKTSIARAIAKTAKVSLVVTSVADWFATSSGHLDAVIRKFAGFCDGLTALAETEGFAVGLIDEFDALPARQTLTDSRNRDYWTPVITYGLLRLEQVRKEHPNIVLIAATNHIENIDAAFLRPGRFDRQIAVTPPDADALAAILRHHLGAELPDLDLTLAARLGHGATGANVVGWVQAARQKGQLGNRTMIATDLLDQIAPLDSRSIAERYAIALHEAGHAIIARDLGYAIRHVTILRRHTTGGVTEIEDIGSSVTAAQIDDIIAIALAGRAADTLLGSGPSSGARSDLQKATKWAAARYATFGLGETLVYRADVEDADKLLAFDPNLRNQIEADLQAIMITTQERVKKFERQIVLLAQALIERRALAGAEVEAVIAEVHE